ncbi:MAG: hypothetical protein ABIM99_01405 [Candidatus Dojkabacteria bacterium]
MTDFQFWMKAKKEGISLNDDQKDFLKKLGIIRIGASALEKDGIDCFRYVQLILSEKGKNEFTRPIENIICELLESDSINIELSPDPDFTDYEYAVIYFSYDISDLDNNGLYLKHIGLLFRLEGKYPLVISKLGDLDVVIHTVNNSHLNLIYTGINYPGNIFFVKTKNLK